ncbi:MAG: NAD-dependent DNA ligase LigA, partial [Clostridiales bacterium]|nr:NAD-dependent DNA ligase LigA [Clostridiales bacterium]
VYKANMIIPQISENLTKSGTCAPPAACPVCGGATRVHDENGVRTLYCENPGCAAKKLGLFTHMAARDAMNIDGLSEATIEKLIDAGLIRTMPDFYKLHEHASEISNLEGFKEKSRDNLLAAIENSRHTTLARLIYSIGIANIGLANAKNIARYVQDDASRIPSLTADELTTIDGIGDVLAASFTEFFASEENRAMYEEMLKELDIAKDTAPASGGLSGKVFVITGSVEHFGNRNELKDYIEARGGKVTGSVTAKTSYLINNDITSSSSKNKTAKELGIPIITEDDFLKLAEEG